MEPLTGLGICCVLLGLTTFAALGARSVLPRLMPIDEVPPQLLPRLTFIDRHRARLAGTAAALMAAALVLPLS